MYCPLLTGAPIYPSKNSFQTGQVFVVMATNGSLPLRPLSLEADAHLILQAPTNVLNARFGHSVVVLDINRDGHQDIVVSAPSYGLANLAYEGRVFIYFGSRNSTYSRVDLDRDVYLLSICIRKCFSNKNFLMYWKACILVLLFLRAIKNIFIHIYFQILLHIYSTSKIRDSYLILSHLT